MLPTHCFMCVILIHISDNTPREIYRAIVVTLCVAMLMPTLPAQASPFKHRAADGTVTFSDAPISNGKVIRNSYKSQKNRPAANNPCKGLSSAGIDAKGQRLNEKFAEASRLSGVPATLLKAVARAESCFEPIAVSRAGAKGLMQLMPHTARSLNVSNSFDIDQNLQGGARYLASMLARYSNNLDMALAAYNAGPSNVDRHKGIPPYKETRSYISSVRAFQDRYTVMQQPSTVLAATEDSDQGLRQTAAQE